MTGRELIIFIMENHLEDTIIFDSDVLPCLMTIDEAAISLNTDETQSKLCMKLVVFLELKSETKRILSSVIIKRRRHAEKFIDICCGGRYRLRGNMETYEG